MNKFRFTLRLLVIAAFVLAFTSIAQAQATRTWVSGVGDDANPCSRTAPCKTFAGAISKTADGGEIDCLDPGGFGAVTITKSITIDGTHGSGFGSVLASLTNGIIINDSNSGAPMTKVVRLRSLSIQGVAGANSGLNGIRYLSAKAVFIEDCLIQNFRGSGGIGIDANLTADGGQLYVRDTIITNCANEGIRATTSAGSLRVIADNVRSDKNSIGFHAVAVTSLSFHLVNCAASSNTADGVKVEGPASAVIDRCTLQSNLVNGLNQVAGSTRLIDSTITNNFSNGVNIAGGTVFSLGGNTIRSNGVSNIVGALNVTETKQ